jgi:hypothetical protein
MADTTAGIVVPNVWTYLYDLVVARRVTTAQMPLKFPHARRFTLISSAAGAIFLTRDPKGNPAGQEVSADDINPTLIEGGGNSNIESLRNFYVKGNAAATLYLDCDY